MSSEVQLYKENPTHHVEIVFSQKESMLKSALCKDLNDEEFQVFKHVCIHTGLDPAMKQVYAIKRGGKLTIQTSIDGYRLIADRTGRYCPGREPTFTYNSKNEVLTATSYIKKQTKDGQWHEVSAVAYWDEYVQADKNGNPIGCWSSMPHSQLAKCAESLALRKAFPAEMCAVRTDEEMQQADAVVLNQRTGEITSKSIDQQEIPISIDQEQVDELMVLTGDDENYRQTLYNFFKIKSFAQLPALQFPSLRNRILARNKVKLEEEMSKTG